MDRRNATTKDGKRRCKGCANWFDLKTFPPGKFRNGNKGFGYRCRPCLNQYQVMYNARHKEQVAKSRQKTKYRAKYGITVEQYNQMVILQNNLCKICLNAPKRKILHIDHCHITGKIRGLLCDTCNRAIGMLGDSVEILQNAITYLSDIDSTIRGVL